MGPGDRPGAPQLELSPDQRVGLLELRLEDLENSRSRRRRFTLVLGAPVVTLLTAIAGAYLL